jgi:AraC family transcriptional regulator
MSLKRMEYYRSVLLSVRYVACRSAEKGLSDVEIADADTLILPLRGVFVEHFSRSTQVIAEPSLALIFPAGRSCKVSHPVSAEDDCLAMEFSADCFRDASEAVLLSGGVSSVGTHSLLSPSVMAARNLLWRRLANGITDPLEVEETGIALLSYALRNSREDVIPQRRSSRIPQQIEAAKVVLLSHSERNWSLTALARELDCSPFYLTRMFREYVGVPLHRYQLLTRLARAIDILLDTDQDLTTIALGLGFSSHSHFTSSFHRLVGFTPRCLREVASCRIAAETRKILIAPISDFTYNS